MFVLEGKMSFINIDQNYLKQLHDICSEVYYKESGYDNKPYIGILLNNDNKKYVIPLSSAKEKQKTWKNINNGCYVIYEETKKENMVDNDIWVEYENNIVKHIISVLDIIKMIPIIEGCYTRVNINVDKDDTEAIRKYKNLLNKEYRFCLKIIDDVIEKAGKLYDKQIKTGKIVKFCCDFAALEKSVYKV